MLAMEGQPEYEERRGRVQAARWFMKAPSETVGTAYAKSFLTHMLVRSPT